MVEKYTKNKVRRVKTRSEMNQIIHTILISLWVLI